MRHINAELNQLTARQKSLSVRTQRNLVDEIRFISQFVPIKGWVLQHKNGSVIINDGAIPVLNLSIKREGWSIDGYRYWSNVTYKNKPCCLGLSIGADAIITDEEMRLLNSLIESSLCNEDDNCRSYVEDVLQRKIQQVQTAGIEYEELRRIIDDSLSGMADGVLICSSRGQVLLSNHRAGWYLFADDDAEINGLSLNEILPYVHQKDGENWKALLQRVLFKQERVLTHVVHQDGRDLMVEISPLRIIGDVLDGFIINFSDISQLKASENKRTEVLNFLSHDLRSPLASMIAMIELAKNKTAVTDMHDMLEGMEKQTNKTLHLAEQFLQLSRANTTENLKFYDIDFNSVVLNAIDQIWALSSKQQVTIKHNFDREELWTKGEPDLLERAIINLLSNAIKHSETNSTVQITVKQSQDDITCCIIDHGSGIAADDVPHLFEMFQRTNGAGVERIQGIGLGLAFVDAVAKRHAGHVNIESILGEGSSFCLVMPKIDTEEMIEEEIMEMDE
jgi:signal transduction histidine kinase